MSKEYENALTTFSRVNTVELNDANKRAFQAIILSIDHILRQGKVSFSPVENCKTAKYSKKNYTLIWDQVGAKYSPKIAPLLLKLRMNLASSQLESVDKYLDEWMTDLESLQNKIDKFIVSTLFLREFYNLYFEQSN